MAVKSRLREKIEGEIDRLERSKKQHYSRNEVILIMKELLD